MKKCFLIVIPVLVVFFFSCVKDPKPFVCTYDPCAVQAPAAEITAVQHYLDSAGITGSTQHCSGLFYKITEAGTGITPRACTGVAVKYKGMLTNGRVFDSSVNGIALSLNRVINGWRNGVPLINTGGKITLYIPPTLGYGKIPQYDRNHPDSVLIPANSIMIFDVEVIDAE